MVAENKYTRNVVDIMKTSKTYSNNYTNITIMTRKMMNITASVTLDFVPNILTIGFHAVGRE